MSEFESIKMSERVLNFKTPYEFKTGQNLKGGEFEFWYGTSIRRQDWTFETWENR